VGNCVGEGGEKIAGEGQNLYKALPYVIRRLACLGLCLEKVEEQQSPSLALFIIMPERLTLQIHQRWFRPLLFFSMS
jgi:hypothetical protein